MEKKLLARWLPRFEDEMRVRNWSAGTIEQYLKSLDDFEYDRAVPEVARRLRALHGRALSSGDGDHRHHRTDGDGVSALAVSAREQAPRRNARTGDAAHVPQRSQIVLRLLRRGAHRRDRSRAQYRAAAHR